MQMIILHPRHPNHLSKDPDSISRTLLEQFAFVDELYKGIKSLHYIQAQWPHADPFYDYAKYTSSRFNSFCQRKIHYGLELIIKDNFNSQDSELMCEQAAGIFSCS